MNNEDISTETYNRLSYLIGKPDEYLEGKVCSYQLLTHIDKNFIYAVDKEYLSDYFLIKDWVRFSIYSGSLFKQIFQEELYKNIPLKNIQLIWNAFNENKKERNGKEHVYYHEKRYHNISDIASFLLKKSKAYEPSEVLVLLKDLIFHLKLEHEDYSLARNCAKFMGDYLTSQKEINEEIFNYLKEEQKIKILDLFLIFYDWQIIRINNVDKLDKIFDLIKEYKPEVTHKQMIKEAIARDRNNFNIIKYINTNFEYKFQEEELEEIFRSQKNVYNMDNTQYIIENFQPANLVSKTFVKIYSSYRYSREIKETEFYNNTIEYLKKKFIYDQLNDKISFRSIEKSKNKISKI